MLNRPLTEKEIFDILMRPPAAWWSDSAFIDLIAGERFQYVRYDAKLGRVVYEDIETFYFTREESPSDSRWMVPK